VELEAFGAQFWAGFQTAPGCSAPGWEHRWKQYILVLGTQVHFGWAAKSGVEIWKWFKKYRCCGSHTV